MPTLLVIINPTSPPPSFFVVGCQQNFMFSFLLVTAMMGLPAKRTLASFVVLTSSVLTGAAFAPSTLQAVRPGCKLGQDANLAVRPGCYPCELCTVCGGHAIDMTILYVSHQVSIHARNCFHYDNIALLVT